MARKVALLLILLACFVVRANAQDDFSSGGDFGSFPDSSTYIYNGSNACGLGYCGDDPGVVLDTSGLNSALSQAFETPAVMDQLEADANSLQQSLSNMAQSVSNGILIANQYEQNVLAGMKQNPVGVGMAVLDTGAGLFADAPPLLTTGLSALDAIANSPPDQAGQGVVSGGETLVVDLSGSAGAGAAMTGIGVANTIQTWAENGANPGPILNIYVPPIDPLLLLPPPNATPSSSDSEAASNLPWPFTTVSSSDVTIVDPSQVSSGSVSNGSLQQSMESPYISNGYNGCQLGDCGESFTNDVGGGNNQPVDFSSSALLSPDIFPNYNSLFFPVTPLPAPPSSSASGYCPNPVAISTVTGPSMGHNVTQVFDPAEGRNVVIGPDAPNSYVPMLIPCSQVSSTRSQPSTPQTNTVSSQNAPRRTPSQSGNQTLGSFTQAAPTATKPGSAGGATGNQASASNSGSKSPSQAPGQHSDSTTATTGKLPSKGGSGGTLASASTPGRKPLSQPSGQGVGPVQASANLSGSSGSSIASQNGLPSGYQANPAAANGSHSVTQNGQYVTSANAPNSYASQFVPTATSSPSPTASSHSVTSSTHAELRPTVFGSVLSPLSHAVPASTSAPRMVRPLGASALDAFEQTLSPTERAEVVGSQLSAPASPALTSVFRPVVRRSSTVSMIAPSRLEGFEQTLPQKQRLIIIRQQLIEPPAPRPTISAGSPNRIRLAARTWPINSRQHYSYKYHHKVYRSSTGFRTYRVQKRVWNGANRGPDSRVHSGMAYRSGSGNRTSRGSVASPSQNRGASWGQVFRGIAQAAANANPPRSGSSGSRGTSWGAVLGALANAANNNRTKATNSPSQARGWHPASRPAKVTTPAPKYYWPRKR